MVASHKYDPYGKTLISSGTLAGANVYRFSSKEIHVNSGLYYYGYRFYDPNLQRWLNRDPINDLGFKTITQNRGRFKRGEEKNLYCFVRNSPPTFCDPLGKDLTGTVVGGVFPESWAVSGNDVPGGGWYAVHCAGHCWEQSINKLLNCPLGKGPALLSIHSVAWELIEISSGPGGWGDEPWSDRLTDLFANTYGALLSKQCVGGCQKCESVWDLVAKANSARKCCDSACAAAQPWFLAMAEVMQLITGGR
jgi:RHS repeat-associated protein